MPTSINTEIILITALTILAVLLLFLLTRRRTTTSEKKTARTDLYLTGLHAMLDGRHEEAIAALKETVKKDTGNVMAYIELGRLMREQGHPIRAAKIHRHLLMRSDLNASATLQTLKQLVHDYEDAGELHKAAEMAERLCERSKKDKFYADLLLSIYEKKGDWDKAIMFTQSRSRWQKKKRDLPRLALYKVASGKNWERQSAMRQGRVRYREAIRLDKYCVPAYISLGDNYASEDRPKDAIKAWKEMIRQCPQWTHLILIRLETAYRAADKADQHLEVLEEAWHSGQAHWQTAHYLTEQYLLGMDIDKALSTSRLANQRFPAVPEIQTQLLYVLAQYGDSETLLNEMKQVIAATSPKPQYSCSRCGFSSPEPPWHCPQCQAWNPYNSWTEL